MSPTSPRVDRGSDDTREALREQIGLLCAHAEQYDSGRLAYAKTIAGTLRLLLHETGRSKSLLGQLGLRQGRFFDRAGGLCPVPNVLTECGLLITRHGPDGVQYLPWTGRVLGTQEFDVWWSEPILRGRGGVTMTRQDVIVAVADMDGGAHVDIGLEPVYQAFRTGELLGWTVDRNGGWTGMGISLVHGAGLPARELMAAPQYACIRTVAHEVLLTVQVSAPWCFSVPYEPTES